MRDLIDPHGQRSCRSSDLEIESWYPCFDDLTAELALKKNPNTPSLIQAEISRSLNFFLFSGCKAEFPLRPGGGYGEAG